ncbi:MAG: hypothetical protein LBO73_04765 [Holosporaceae bacterium]|jgi:hypothetical protein|nr:hypothetical protein [Holosporaceae bacterium]
MSEDCVRCLSNAFAKTLDARETADIASSALNAFRENFQKLHSPDSALDLLDVNDVKTIESAWNVSGSVILCEKKFVKKMVEIYAIIANLTEDAKSAHVRTTESSELFKQSAKLTGKKLRMLELLCDCTDLYLLWRLLTSSFFDVDVYGIYAGKVLELYSHCCATAVKHNLHKNADAEKRITVLRDFLFDASVYILPETELDFCVKFLQKYPLYADVIAELKKVKKYYKKYYKKRSFRK